MCYISPLRHPESRKIIDTHLKLWYNLIEKQTFYPLWWNSATTTETAYTNVSISGWAIVGYFIDEFGNVLSGGIKDGVDVYLDESMKRFETVFPAVGGSNSAIELTIEELEKYSNYKEWVDVSKPIE